MKTIWLQHGPQGSLITQVILGLFTLFCLVALTVGVAYADNPVPVQTFYLPLPETDALTVLNAIHSDADPPMYTYFSIAVGFDNTYVYYDQWEDGYATDIANPTPDELYDSATNPGGVQIWGNGLAADGCAPNINGVAFACTDGADVLNAGDNIIPYNLVPEPRDGPQLYALDAFSTVAYNNNDGNTNWSDDWVETGDFLTANYRDQFGTSAYNNSDGSLDWSGSSWTEVGDDGSATTGYTLIINGVLRFGRYSAASDAIWRTADVSAYSSATLSFTLDGNSIDGAQDAIAVQISGDGGSNWTDLETFSTDPNGATFTYDVTGYIAANTAVRFIMVGDDLVDFDERWRIDNVDLTVSTGGGSSPSSGDILITGGQLRLSETEANTSIDRGVSLPTGDACATLSFTLGQNGIDADEDRLAVQVSSDGGANYSTLETFDNSSDAGAKSYIISGYASADTRVRFISLDALETGEYWTIDNVRVEWDCSFTILFDARDKVGASEFVSMARAVWADNSSTLNAYAHEMYSTEEWGTTYESPVGSNTGAAGSPSRYQFQYSALTIMASQDDTQVQSDANADGTFETTVVLQEGESTLVTGILQGARVEADKPVQVAVLTGDINDTYESRDMSLLPISSWGSSYWSPVGVMWNANPTRLYLYNLSTNGSIYITCERYGVANTTLGPVAPRGVVTIDLGANQGARCYASDSGGNATGELFFGVGTIDTAAGDGGGDDGSRSDWSVTLFPDDFLTTDALVGLGLGKDPYDATSTENGSPLWVTAACPSGSTYVYVDWDNDGTADPVDTNGDDVAEGGSQNGILVNRLQSVRLFEPGADEEEFDQSGARVWSRTASGVGYGGTAGCRLSVAWGQDPNNATAADPGLDVGTSVPPLRLTEGTKSLALKTDADSDGLLSPGDTATYNMTIHNSMLATVANVHIHDLVPDNTTYVANSTEKDTGSGWTSIPDDGSGTPFPLDVTGGVLVGDLSSGATFYVRFDVTLDAATDYEELLNCDTAFAAGTFTRCAATFVASYDWGDLPDTYGTERAADGPRHSPSGLRLGSVFDHELEGQPATDAGGDDMAYTLDEEGVTLGGTQAQWGAGNGRFWLTVAGGPGCLNAWMDFTDDTGSGAGMSYADGNFTNTGGYDTYSTYSEYIIQNALVVTGTSSVPVAVPPGLNPGATNLYYFRFRLSPPVDGLCTDPIAPTGFVSGGEVEDYRFELMDAPTAVKLLGFEVTGYGDHVLIEWETAQELDNAGFNLYRTETPYFDDPSWADLGFIPAQLPGQICGADYSHTDSDIQGGTACTYYYWLEDVDFHGSSTGHGPVSTCRPTETPTLLPTLAASRVDMLEAT